MTNANTTKIYQISFLLTFSTALIMLSSNVEQMSKVRTVETKTEVCTGVVQPKEDWKQNISKTIQAIWTLIPSANAQTNESVKNVKTSIPFPIECDQKCKSKILVDAWISNNLAKEIVNVCKELANDPVHCIKYASSISSAESGWWKKCYNNNCFWIKAWTIWFKTLNDWVIDWVTRYNKYWWKATSMSQFYAPKWKLPYFRYCTSENSSNSKVWCPFGLKHSTSTFKKINF